MPRRIVEQNRLCVSCIKRPIFNKTYGLCRICNHKRIHPEENFFEKKKRKNEEYIQNKIEKMRFSILRDPLLNDNICSEIGCSNPVSTKKSGLCNFHNKIKKEKVKISIKSIDKKTKNKKEIEVKRKLSKIKSKAKEGKYICEGCDKNKLLQYSHILSVAQRKDLEIDENNKNLLCQTCHSDWESWDAKKMFNLSCINYNLNYIRQNDEKTFWKIYYKCIDSEMYKEAKEMEKIDEEYKNKN